MSELRWLEIENTGFSGGISWFPCLGKRFDTFKDAKEKYDDLKWDTDVKWRIVEVILTRYFEDETNPTQVTKEIKQKRYLYL